MEEAKNCENLGLEEAVRRGVNEAGRMGHMRANEILREFFENLPQMRAGEGHAIRWEVECHIRYTIDPQDQEGNTEGECDGEMSQGVGPLTTGNRPSRPEGQVQNH